MPRADPAATGAVVCDIARVSLLRRLSALVTPAWRAHKARPGPRDLTNGRGLRKRVSPSWRRMRDQAERTYLALHGCPR